MCANFHNLRGILWASACLPALYVTFPFMEKFFFKAESCYGCSYLNLLSV